MEYAIIAFILANTNANICDSDYDRSYESVLLHFEYTTGTSKELNNLLVSSNQDSYYGLANSITDANKNALIISIDNLLNVRWTVYVNREIIPESFLLSPNDRQLYYIQINSGCDLVRRPSAHGGHGFTKRVPFGSQR